MSKLVTVHNTGNDLLLVNGVYLFPGESRLASQAEALRLGLVSADGDSSSDEIPLPDLDATPNADGELPSAEDEEAGESAAADLDTLNKAELLELAGELGLTTVTNTMSKAALKAALDEHISRTV